MINQPGHGQVLVIDGPADIDGLGEADVVVAFGGITFTPGRRLVAVEDGVVVLPNGVIESDIDIANRLA